VAGARGLQWQAMAPSGPRVRLERRDWWLIAVCLAVAAVSLLVVSRYFRAAFPQASIDFQVSGAGSEPVAAAFLKSQGLSPAGFMHAEQFGYDGTAMVFLERELGLGRSQGLMSRRLQLWRWQNRWFQPLSREEFLVSVSTAGPVVGFQHEISTDAAGANLTEAQALAVAERFLTQAVHQHWQHWVMIGAAQHVRPHRTDYDFTWRDAAPLVPQARGALALAQHRHRVEVQGAKVGGYSDYLEVPQQWQLGYARLRSKNQDAGLVDTGLLLVVAVAMLFVLLGRIRRGDIRWRPALWVGAAGAGLSLLASLNGFGAARFSYPTTTSWPAFVADTLIGYVFSAGAVGAFFVVLTAAAESLYRERFGRHMAVESFLSRRGLRSKTLFLSLVIGLALAAFFFAYQTVFYLIANHFGAWAPADIPYDDLLNTQLPWAFVLFSGFFPAISEEFGFRMLAIPLFEKWFRWLWVAVIAAAFLWGFGHATYPNEPFYIRGLEVGLGGILLGWIMIRFGILATVVWHYTVDALYTAMLLLRAHDLYLRSSGAISALLALAPLLLAIAAYLRYGGFEPEADLSNAAVGTAGAEAAPAAAGAGGVEVGAEAEAGAAGAARAPIHHTPYEPIPGPNWTAGLIVAGALLSAFAVPVPRWKTALPWRLGPQAAEAAARNFLQAQGYALAGYRPAAMAVTAAGAQHGRDNGIAANDIFRRRGAVALIRAFSAPGAGHAAIPAEYWQVRWFRPLQPEEFLVAVRADTGAVIGFAHVLPQTAPGGAPPLAQARATAANFLRHHGIHVRHMVLLTAVQEQRPARVDSTFVWQSTLASPLPGEVSYRAEADLAGRRVSFFTAWYHVPEARVRAYSQTTLSDSLLGLARDLLISLSAALLFYLIYRFARGPGLSWSTLLKLAAVGGAVMLALSANALPAALAGYSTSIPLSSFWLSTWISLLVTGLFGFLATLALLAPLAITAPEAAGLTVANARRQLERESAWDALWVGLLGLAWALGWQRVQEVIGMHWHAAGAARLPSPPAGLLQAVPGLSEALGAPLHALWAAAGLGILLPVLWHGWRAPAWRGWTLAAVALLWVGMIAPAHNAAALGLSVAFAGLDLLLLFSFAALFLRRSPLAYFSTALLPLLVAPALAWLAIDAAPAGRVGAILLLLAVAWLLWLAWVSRAAGETPASGAAPAR
jgi:membrane protease YdiL (CAAX protease family)